MKYVSEERLSKEIRRKYGVELTSEQSSIRYSYRMARLTFCLTTGMPLDTHGVNLLSDKNAVVEGVRSVYEAGFKAALQAARSGHVSERDLTAALSEEDISVSEQLERISSTNPEDSLKIKPSSKVDPYLMPFKEKDPLKINPNLGIKDLTPKKDDKLFMKKPIKDDKWFLK